MRPKLLFPSYFRIIGIVLLIPGLVLGFLFTFYDYVLPFLSYGRPQFFRSINNFTDEWIVTLILCGELLIAFSRLKNESRLVHRIRLNALYWTIVFNCGLILVVCFLAALLALCKVRLNNWDFPINYVLYNPLLIMPVFYARFNYLLIRIKKGVKLKPLRSIPEFPYGIVGKTNAVLFVIALVFSLAPSNKIDVSSDTFTLVYLFLVLPSVLVAIWSKDKNEINHGIRLRTMQIAVYINFGLLLIATWTIYGQGIFVVLEFSFASIQIIFLLVFYLMRRSSQRKALSAFAKPVCPTPGS